MANWIENTICGDSLIRQLGSAFVELERQSQGTFPDLRQDKELVMACDYAGEHKNSPFQVLTFLLADRPGVLQRWEGERLRIRQEHLRDGRRLSFKGLGDALKQKALIPFLKASADINGIVLCMAVDKSLAESGLGYQFPSLGNVKPLVLAKMVKIALFGSFLVGGLGAKGRTCCGSRTTTRSSATSARRRLPAWWRTPCWLAPVRPGSGRSAWGSAGSSTTIAGRRTCVPSPTLSAGPWPRS